MAKLDCITTPTRAHGLWTVIGLEFIFLAMQLLKIYFFYFAVERCWVLWSNAELEKKSKCLQTKRSLHVRLEKTFSPSLCSVPGSFMLCDYCCMFLLLLQRTHCPCIARAASRFRVLFVEWRRLEQTQRSHENRKCRTPGQVRTRSHWHQLSYDDLLWILFWRCWRSHQREGSNTVTVYCSANCFKETRSAW